MKTVYLAGPIAGCDKSEANDWRSELSAALARHNIRGISPLRCEPAVNGRYDIGMSADRRFGTPRAICSKNYFDTVNCDMVLCYFPRALNERRLSIGTVMELAWAHAFAKRPIVVTDYDVVRNHPVVQEAAGWILETLDEAEDVIVGILGDYARPLPSEPEPQADLRYLPEQRLKQQLEKRRKDEAFLKLLQEKRAKRSGRSQA